jgi:hypothetical protein
MTKENRDPVTMVSKEIPTTKNIATKLPKQMEKPTQKSIDSPKNSNVNNATDLFELLERCQSQRLDDQRCVLPSYFSQVSYHPRKYKSSIHFFSKEFVEMLLTNNFSLRKDIL